MTSKRSIAGYSLVISALLLSGACSRRAEEGTRGRARDVPPATAAKTEVAFVRFVDAHKGSADLYFGDVKVFSGTNESVTSDYKEVPAERRQFTLRDAAQASAEPLAANTE